MFLVFGLLVAAYLRTQGPEEQHVHVVLGDRASEVVGVDSRYVGGDGETARNTQFHYEKGRAPRIVSHEPELPNGDYRFEIDVDLAPSGADNDGGAKPEGRVPIQRQVRLGGGSTQIDISTALHRAAAGP